MTRTHAVAWAVSIAIVAVILALSACAPDGQPGHCPPPLGCSQ